MRPTGLLFRAILHLSDEENLSFMFPAARLPVCTITYHTHLFLIFTQAANPANADERNPRTTPSTL